MTFGEPLAAAGVLLALTILLWLFIAFLTKHIVASYYYCRFTYEAYIAALRGTTYTAFDYDDCVSAASSLYRKLTSRLTVRNLLTKIITFFHKRRHPEGYI